MNKPDFYKSCDIIEFIDSIQTEGKQLASLFDQHGVRYAFKEAKDYKSIDDLFFDFTNEITTRNALARKNGEPLYAPELHLSCHGCDQGIGWKDGSLVTWNKLSNLLWSFSKAIGYTTSPHQNGAFAQETSCVSLSLSCCHGSFAANDFFKTEPYPIGGFMAPNNEIYIDDCARFFLEFYKISIKEPWNAPEKVKRILSNFTPKGPSGFVSIECYSAPLTTNLNYTNKKII